MDDDDDDDSFINNFLKTTEIRLKITKGPCPSLGRKLLYLDYIESLAGSR